MEGNKLIKKINQDFIKGALIGGGFLALILVVVFVVFMAVNEWRNPFFNNIDDSLPTLEELDGPETETITNQQINTFYLKKDAEICKENGLPIVYLFSVSWCSHCKWIGDTFDRVMTDYMKLGKIVAYHYDVETGDNLLTPEKESELPSLALNAYNEFSPNGGVPSFVFGCKYFRLGNGYSEEAGLRKEEGEFRAILAEIAP